MASTNKTTNYKLSQYVGSDKPTYLGDYNSDMNKIDTQMKSNADGIASATSTANTALTNAENATTLVNQVQEIAETANTNASNALQKAISLEQALDLLRPVGSYFETTDASFNPNNVWAGTWVLEKDGTVLASSGGDGSVFNVSLGDIVGSETHTLTINEMPSHQHSFKARVATLQAGSNYGAYIADGSTSVNATGGGQPHSIVQPTKVVNRWHRTA